jgi:hypothetical protein
MRSISRRVGTKEAKVRGEERRRKKKEERREIILSRVF